EAVEYQPHHQRHADPAQRISAAGAAAEHAAQAIEHVAQATTTAAATALGRPWIATVAAGAWAFGPLAVVLAGNVPGHACSSVVAPCPCGRRRMVYRGCGCGCGCGSGLGREQEAWPPVARMVRSCASGSVSLQGGVGL